MKHYTKEAIPLPIMMTREKYVTHPSQDRGWHTHGVVAFIGTQRVGWLKISWIADFDRLYPDLESYRKVFGQFRGHDRMRTTKEFHGNPHVASVGVVSEHQRKHIALALYREAALWLAQDWTLPLRQGDPNATAVKVWEKLRDLGEPISQVEIFNYGSRLQIDYRKTAALLREREVEGWHYGPPEPGVYIDAAGEYSTGTKPWFEG